MSNIDYFLSRIGEVKGYEDTDESELEYLLSEEVEEVDTLESFREYLNEVYPDDVDVCGHNFDPVTLLEQYDPVAFRESYLCWLDSNDDINMITFDGDAYYEYNVVLDFIDDLEPKGA